MSQVVEQVVQEQFDNFAETITQTVMGEVEQAINNLPKDDFTRESVIAAVNKSLASLNETISNVITPNE